MLQALQEARRRFYNYRRTKSTESARLRPHQYSDKYMGILQKYQHIPPYHSQIKPYLTTITQALSQDGFDMSEEEYAACDKQTLAALSEANRLRFEMNRILDDKYNPGASEARLYQALVQLQRKLAPIAKKLIRGGYEPKIASKIIMLNQWLQRIEKFDYFTPDTWADVDTFIAQRTSPADVQESKQQEAVVGELAKMVSALNMERATAPASPTRSHSKDDDEDSKSNASDASSEHSYALDVGAQRFSGLARQKDKKGRAFIMGGSEQAPTSDEFFSDSEIEPAVKDELLTQLYGETPERTRELIDIGVTIMNMATAAEERAAKRLILEHEQGSMKALRSNLAVIRRLAMSRLMAFDPDLQGSVTQLSCLAADSLRYVMTKLLDLYHRNKAVIANCIALEHTELSPEMAIALGEYRAYHEGVDDTVRHNIETAMREIHIRLQDLADPSCIIFSKQMGIHLISDPLYTHKRSPIVAELKPETLQARTISNIEILSLVKIYVQAGNSIHEVNRLLFGAQPTLRLVLGQQDQQIYVEFNVGDQHYREGPYDRLPDYGRTALLVHAARTFLPTGSSDESMSQDDFTELMYCNLDMIDDLNTYIDAILEKYLNGNNSQEVRALYEKQIVELANRQNDIIHSFVEHLMPSQLEVLRDEGRDVLQKMRVVMQQVCKWDGFNTPLAKANQAMLNKQAASSLAATQRRLAEAQETKHAAKSFDAHKEDFGKLLRQGAESGEEPAKYFSTFSKSSEDQALASALLTSSYPMSTKSVSKHSSSPMLVVACAYCTAEQVQGLLDVCKLRNIEISAAVRQEAVYAAIRDGSAKTAMLLHNPPAVDVSKILKVSTASSPRKLACLNALIDRNPKYVTGMESADIVQLVKNTNQVSAVNLSPVLVAISQSHAPTFSQAQYKSMCEHLVAINCPSALFLVMQAMQEANIRSHHPHYKDSRPSKIITLTHTDYMNLLALATMQDEPDKLAQVILTEFESQFSLEPMAAISTARAIELGDTSNPGYELFINLSRVLNSLFLKDPPPIGAIRSLLQTSSAYFRSSRVTSLIVDKAREGLEPLSPAVEAKALGEYESGLRFRTDGDTAGVQCDIEQKASVRLETVGEFIELLHHMMSGVGHIFIPDDLNQKPDELVFSKDKSVEGYTCYMMRKDRSWLEKRFEMGGKHDDQVLQMLLDMAENSADYDAPFVQFSTMIAQVETRYKAQTFSTNLNHLMRVLASQSATNFSTLSTHQKLHGITPTHQRPGSTMNIQRPQFKT